MCQSTSTGVHSKMKLVQFVLVLLKTYSVQSVFHKYTFYKTVDCFKSDPEVFSILECSVSKSHEVNIKVDMKRNLTKVCVFPFTISI